MNKKRSGSLLINPSIYICKITILIMRYIHKFSLGSTLPFKLEQEDYKYPACEEDKNTIEFLRP